MSNNENWEAKASNLSTQNAVCFFYTSLQLSAEKISSKSMKILQCLHYLAQKGAINWNDTRMMSRFQGSGYHFVFSRLYFSVTRKEERRKTTIRKKMKNMKTKMVKKSTTTVRRPYAHTDAN